MTPWVRTTLWLGFWATLVVSVLLGLFLAWLLTDVLPPGTAITIDDDRFVLPAFNETRQWVLAAIGVFVAAMVVVIVLPIVTVLAIVVPVAVGSLGLLAGLAVVGLVLWPLVLLARWLWKDRQKPNTIAP